MINYSHLIDKNKLYFELLGTIRKIKRKLTLAFLPEAIKKKKSHNFPYPTITQVFLTNVT